MLIKQVFPRVKGVSPLTPNVVLVYPNQPPYVLLFEDIKDLEDYRAKNPKGVVLDFFNLFANILEQTQSKTEEYSQNISQGQKGRFFSKLASTDFGSRFLGGFGPEYCLELIWYLQQYFSLKLKKQSVDLFDKLISRIVKACQHRYQILKNGISKDPQNKVVTLLNKMKATALQCFLLFDLKNTCDETLIELGVKSMRVGIELALNSWIQYITQRQNGFRTWISYHDSVDRVHLRNKIVFEDAELMKDHYLTKAERQAIHHKIYPKYFKMPVMNLEFEKKYYKYTCWKLRHGKTNGTNGFDVTQIYSRKTLHYPFKYQKQLQRWTLDKTSQLTTRNFTETKFRILELSQINDYYLTQIQEEVGNNLQNNQSYEVLSFQSMFNFYDQDPTKLLCRLTFVKHISARLPSQNTFSTFQKCFSSLPSVTSMSLYCGFNSVKSEKWLLPPKVTSFKCFEQFMRPAGELLLCLEEESLSKLEEFEYNFPITDDYLFRNLKNLRKLKAPINLDEDAHFESFEQILTCKLTDLDLSNIELKPVGQISLSKKLQVFAKAKKLRYLKIKSQDNLAIKGQIKHLIEHPSLEYLTFDCAKTGADSQNILEWMVNKCLFLRNSKSLKEVKFLFPRVFKSPGQMRYLDTARQYMANTGIKLIIDCSVMKIDNYVLGLDKILFRRDGFVQFASLH